MADRRQRVTWGLNGSARALGIPWNHGFGNQPFDWTRPRGTPERDLRSLICASVSRWSDGAGELTTVRCVRHAWHRGRHRGWLLRFLDASA